MAFQLKRHAGVSKSDASMPKPPEFKAVRTFCIFTIANLVAALFSPIQDCDEVFNYWEPSHYLNHGYGLQTWEYSPEFAIRSWTYTGLHSLIISVAYLPIKLLRFDNPKVIEFYLLRTFLALVCGMCQTRLCLVVARTLNPRVAMFFMIILVTSPGMYHAAPAYLPSSFTMYTTMLGFSAFMDWSRDRKTSQGIVWFGVGSILGWPFAGVLVVPFVIEEIILASLNGKTTDAFWRLTNGSIKCFSILALQTAIDSLLYRRITCVPLNIIMYNIFSGRNKGPNIFGVEPWHYYFRNLILNFNIWFLLAMSTLPLLLIHHIAFCKTISKQILLRSIALASPFYLWLVIFTVQPHKEERFMYPAYPALALNAAISLHILLARFGSANSRHIGSRVLPQWKLVVVAVPLLVSFNTGALRTIGTMTAYSAPLNVYSYLNSHEVTQHGDNVCLGKEWYRFPSSFHLPGGVRARFIKSEFSGLLPGNFNETRTGFDLFPATWLSSSGMNDENREDTGKYIAIEECNFLVDSHFPGSSATALEPDYISDTEKWEKLKCLPFLDASQTHVTSRLLWIPELPLIPNQYRRKWGEYCLLGRKDQS